MSYATTPRGTDNGGVFLDFAGCDFERLLADKSRSFARMWPLTHEWYKEKGTDLYRDPVQITCSAHAINGGLRIDGNAETSLRGLYAAGETAAGPHGADRLGGNMAMTCQVFGERAGRAAAARAVAMTLADASESIEAHEDYLAGFTRKGSRTGSDLRWALQNTANRHLLILRNEAGLTRLLSDLDNLQRQLKTETRADTPAEFIHLIETDNLIETGRMMAQAALARRESRGSHYREDAPATDQTMAKSQIIDRNHSSGSFFASLDTL